jgi:hypothetical protein
VGEHDGRGTVARGPVAEQGDCGGAGKGHVQDAVCSCRDQHQHPPGVCSFNISSLHVWVPSTGFMGWCCSINPMTRSPGLFSCQDLAMCSPGTPAIERLDCQCHVGHLLHTDGEGCNLDTLVPMHVNLFMSSRTQPHISKTPRPGQALPSYASINRTQIWYGLHAGNGAAVTRAQARYQRP